MANSVKKQKAYQTFCRNQVKAGLINMPNGTWASGSGAMARDMVAGYRFSGGGKKKRAKAEAEVE